MRLHERIHLDRFGRRQHRHLNTLIAAHIAGALKLLRPGLAMAEAERA